MSVVDDYLATIGPPQENELERVRSLVKRIVPEAEEVLGYGIPTFKFRGKNLLHLAAFQDHLSIFPGPDVIAGLQKELAGYTLSRGTIQFTLEEPLPDELLTEIITRCRDRIEQV